MRPIHLTKVLLLAASACGDNSGVDAPRDGAIVTFAFEATNDTLRVHVRDSATIARAESRVGTGQGPRMPVGPIVRGAGVDPRFPFHYLPNDIRLADLAIEVCDGRPMRTPQQVTEFFTLATGNGDATSATWCPWGARPIAVQRLSASGVR